MNTGTLWFLWSLVHLTVTHHAELGLGLLHQILLLRLADAGEDARLRVEVQHVALEIGEEVAKTADATHSHHTLGAREEGKGSKQQTLSGFQEKFKEVREKG